MYKDRRTRCTLNRSQAGSRDKMERRNSGMLKACIKEDAFSSFCVVPGSDTVRKIERASFGGTVWLANGRVTLNWHNGLCVCQWARRQAAEQ